MAQPKLVSPDQPFALRAILSVYEFSASLKLAVVLIFAMAFALGYATFVEAAYGTPVVQYFVYQTWWFNGLNILLGVNIFCAAAIRYPWQRHQTGFVITHIGLLVLLAGAAIGRQYGIDAQIPVFESRMERYAFDRTNLFFDISIEEDHDESSAHDHSDFIQTLRRVPFPAGPFNWEDYDTQFTYNLRDGVKYGAVEGFLKNSLRWTSGHIFKLANRATPGTVLIDSEIPGTDKQLKIEVLEFMANSQMSSEPRVEMVVGGLPEKYLNEDNGRQEERPGEFPPGPPNAFSVTIQPLPDSVTEFYGDIYPYGFSQPMQAGGGKVMLWIAPDATYQKAFLEAAPRGELGTAGQVVISVDGTIQHLDLNLYQVGDTIELEETDYTLLLNGLWNDVVEGKPGTDGTIYGYSEKVSEEPVVPTVHLQVLDQSGTPLGRDIVLFANKPHHNVYDYKNKVYGTYWFDFSTKEIQPFGPNASQDEVYSRIEFLQGADSKLYYRYWNRRTNQLVQARNLNEKGSPETAVSGFQMPQFENPLQFYVSKFVSSEKPELAATPLPFDRDKQIVQREVRAKVKVKWGDKEEEHWIRAFVGAPGERQQPDQQIRIHDDKAGNTLVLSMPTEAFDIGFRIRLKDFERKLDPGTSQASHYSSWVDFVDLKNTQEIWVASDSGVQAESIGVPVRANADDAVPNMTHQNVQGFAFDQQNVYWLDTNQRQLNVTNIETKETRSVVSNDSLRALTGTETTNAFINNPRGLILEGGRLFWIDEIGGTSVIQSVETSGKSPTRIIHSPGKVVQILANSQQSQLYWLNASAGQISRSNFEGQKMQIGIIDGLKRPTSIAINAENQQLYWAERDPTTPGSTSRGRIMQSTIPKDKSSDINPRAIITLEVDTYATSIAFHPAKRRLAYITAEKPRQGYIGHHTGTVHRTHHLMTCNSSGGDIQEVAANGIDLADHLLIHDDKFYWNQSASFQHDIYITMNAPVEFDSPTNDHSYRLFQESFSGPWKPGDPEYERIIPSDSQQEDLYLSVLTVNRDPGRAIRNLGCLIVCLGIAIMFYMKAYFFKPRKKKGEPDQESKIETSETKNE
ncbi:MAG: hypothetical protein VW875_12450 [Planctomycetaceae bacterium]